MLGDAWLFIAFLRTLVRPLDPVLVVWLEREWQRDGTWETEDKLSS